MFDIFQDNTDKNVRSIEKQSILNQHIPASSFQTINNDLNESNSLKSESPSSFVNPPSPTFFLQNFTFNSFPSLDYVINKQTQIKNKSLRFIKVTNDLSNKINLLEEIYDGPEYKRLKMSNKLIECQLDEEAPHKLVAKLVAKLNTDPSCICDRTVHPAYSTEDPDDEQAMDSSGLFKVPSAPVLAGDLCQDFGEMERTMFTTDMDQCQSSDMNESQEMSEIPEVPVTESLFLEHDGNTYIQVDDTNYHLVQSISDDGVVITETGLQIIVPDGTEVPMMGPPLYDSDKYQHPVAQDQLMYRENQAPMTGPGRKNNSGRTDISPFFGHLSYHQNNGGIGLGGGGPVKPYSDYVALPLRPAPQTPFTLSSQLYTPELSISLTEQECELMLTIDSMKRTLPQQTPICYQIYSYKDEDRHAKPTGEVWGLVGEIKACTLPMFCTISIPSGYHKHYFAIRSVDEFCRFSDWSNVVQVEVENNQHLTNKR